MIRSPRDFDLNPTGKLGRESTNTNFIVFGLTQMGLESTNYRTWDVCRFLILSITTIAATMLNIDFRTTITVNMFDFIFNEPRRLCNYKFVPSSVDRGFVGSNPICAKPNTIKLDNVSEWGDTSTCWLLSQWASIMKIQLSVLVLS
jgi:hypothetical protein